MFDDLRPELNLYGKSHMITPNFDRLASRSVIFDHAYCQVAVCNPSRDSLLTGLRPDTIGTIDFQHTYFPHLILPTDLLRSNYKTIQFGKIRHWDDFEDPYTWSIQFGGDWYRYQNYEHDHMNSSVMPDKIKPEHEFNDYIFASNTTRMLKQAMKDPQPFFLAVGFKMPHTSLHIPYRYYQMYRRRLHRNVWKKTDKEREFPKACPLQSFRYCAEPYFAFMNEEGAKFHLKYELLLDVNHIVSQEMHNELMMGYSAAVTFVDHQLGRVLDTLDELDLWYNFTVILTSDHGMHNGEKGMW
jgi:arylsulfatase A-like enzyme